MMNADAGAKGGGGNIDTSMWECQTVVMPYAEDYIFTTSLKSA